MTYLIADSGATKTEWRLVANAETKTILTEGLNPYYHTAESIQNVISAKLLPELQQNTIDKIWFYGAGCDSLAKKDVVQEALGQAFASANVEVEHDLLAAARACLFDQPGIACILGTGSNSCLYDGQKIVEHIPSLAFILGDEGSAGYFGKKLINQYFRDELPEDLKKCLKESHNMSLSHIMAGLYDGPQPSRFIASYGKFLGDHKNHPFINSILRKGFGDFIARIVKKYTGAAEYKVGFIGSVAWAHQDVIRKILEEEGMRAGLFIQNPLERLIKYHTS